MRLSKSNRMGCFQSVIPDEIKTPSITVSVKATGWVAFNKYLKTKNINTDVSVKATGWVAFNSKEYNSLHGIKKSQ